MKIVATIPCRNSGWILGLTARAALMWCDAVVLGLHECADNSLQIATQLEAGSEGRVIICKLDGGWDEMQHRQYLIETARMVGATHVAIVDDDEIVTGSIVPHMREWCARMQAGWTLELPQINIRGRLDQMHTAGIWAQQHTPMVFRDDPRYHWAAAGDGYQHHARAPKGLPYRPFRPVTRCGVAHLQMIEEGRLRWKQWLYQLSDYERWPGRKTPEQLRQYYSLAVYGFVPPFGKPNAVDSWNIAATMPHLGPVPGEWWEPYRDILKHLDLKAEPWQREACRAIIARHPEYLDMAFDDFGMRELL